MDINNFFNMTCEFGKLNQLVIVDNKKKIQHSHTVV